MYPFRRIFPGFPNQNCQSFFPLESCSPANNVISQPHINTACELNKQDPTLIKRSSSYDLVDNMTKKIKHTYPNLNNNTFQNNNAPQKIQELSSDIQYTANINQINPNLSLDQVAAGRMNQQATYEYWMQQMMQQHSVMLQKTSSFNQSSLQSQNLTPVFKFDQESLGPLLSDQDTYSSDSQMKYELDGNIITKEEPIKIEQELQSLLSTIASEEKFIASECRIKKINHKNKKESLNRKPVKSKHRRISTANLENFLWNDLAQNKKAEPRAKNKWQVKYERRASESNRSTEPILSPLETVLDVIDKPQSNEESLKAEPLQGSILSIQDSNLDYNYLLSVTISKNPMNQIPNSESQATFIVSNQYETYVSSSNRGSLKAKTIQIGEDHQAKIPNLQDKNSSEFETRSWPTLAWNPLVLTQREINLYFSELKKLLRCENINQERALNMLKKKNYKHEKVCLNVSKNVKFYSAFLTGLDLKIAEGAI